MTINSFIQEIKVNRPSVIYWRGDSIFTINIWSWQHMFFKVFHDSNEVVDAHQAGKCYRGSFSLSVSLILSLSLSLSRLSGRSCTNGQHSTPINNKIINTIKITQKVTSNIWVMCRKLKSSLALADISAQKLAFRKHWCVWHYSPNKQIQTTRPLEKCFVNRRNQCRFFWLGWEALLYISNWPP